MPLLPLQLPPGVYRNGTDYQSAGRWYDSNLVRWTDNTLQPMNGWRLRWDTPVTSKTRAMISWRDNLSNRLLAAASYDKLYVYNAAIQYDITPVGLTAGTENASVNLGYGGSSYGGEEYGIPRLENALVTPATSWTLDMWGEYLIACSDEDGRIFEWQLNTASPAAVVANAPIDNESICVTNERFVFAIGAGGVARKVQWCDREDNTNWTPAATNEAGDIELKTQGRLLRAVSTGNQTLILGTVDAFVARYIGPPYVYSFEQVGSSCGIVGKQAVAVVDAGALWMGYESFYMFNGSDVVQIQCDVDDYVFRDINRGQISKVYAVVNSNHGEIWWFYPSSESVENDRYVVFNYIDNAWYIGQLARTAGVDGDVFGRPIFAGVDLNLYEHEIGWSYDGNAPYAESGPISLGAGDNVMRVTQMIPDELSQGQVQAIFKTRFHPNDTERQYGPYSMSNPTSVRFTGRQVKMRVEGVEGADWRVGVNRLEVSPGGKR